MIFRVLGQLAVGDGRVALPTGHQLTVLAVLLVNPNRRVSRAELMRWAWGAAEVRPTQLDKQASYVRSFLAGLPGKHSLVTYKGFGYELRVAESEHDMLTFERLIRDAGRAAGEAGDLEASLLRQALRLWRGRHPLEGVPGAMGVTLGAELISRRKRALVRLCDLEFARGRHAEVLDDLRLMVGYHPTDKRLTEQLMLALHHNGHTTEALEVYDAHVETLDRTVGTNPDPGLRDLYYAIARGDDEAVAARGGGVAPRRAPRPVDPLVTPRQLPPAPANFVGRGEVVQEVQWLLSRTGSGPRVVVLTGPGGIGKTALAVHVAHRVRDNYPDGQLVVELGGTRAEAVPTAEVLAQVLRAFGLTRIPESREERAALLRSVLSDKRALLILDDAHDEAQVQDLIPGSPGCAVLVTARQRQPMLAGAHHVPALLPLDREESLDLYQRVVRDAGVRTPAARGGAERLAAARIVELCAGLPLAVWVAAALRAEDGGPSAPELAARLADQPLASLVFRDRSVARTIGAGIDRLDGSARTLFLGLGLLPLPDIAPWTAAAVLDADPYEPLRRLAARYLLHPAGEGGRYRFHDLHRELAGLYARDDSAAASWRNAVVERVYRTLLTLVRHAHHAIYGGDYEVVHGTTPLVDLPSRHLEPITRSPMTWYETERLNIRAAVKHCCELGLTEIAWDLAVSSHEFYNRRGYLDDWAATHQVALAACRDAGNVRGEAALLAVLGQPALVTGRRPGVSGIDDLHRAARLFRQADDVHGEAIAQRTLGNALRHAGRFDEALDAFQVALKGYTAVGDAVGRWQALRYIGQLHLDLGRADRAVSLLREAEAAARGIGRPLPQAQTAYWLGRAHLETADPAAAKDNFRSVLALVDDADEVGMAWGHFGLGDIALAAGRHADADQHLGLAAQLAGHAGDALLEGRVALSQAALFRAARRIPDARSRLDRAIFCFTAATATHLRERAEAERKSLL
ncbi:AfsR/SARP family transcriptional regulator [Virgisporangium ochraceum]|uniref:SARP family transcriptional regulator n=1 Tax=Virgisporangium ochraceum TaxID=65505 RepID=A0A8J4ECR9_9ACTN|nr:BTAD domain-containing putative transcriptional regulator [Virgisporangium ochraceum]GIJ67182.1 SARP family transcriptional regulator [Virgisporangium ochraceum]